MIVSSRLGSGCSRGRSEGPAVAQQCLQHVDQASGQGEQCLGVDPHNRHRGQREHHEPGAAPTTTPE